ncbi:PAS domain S-box protein [Marinomonas pontica]|uniref:PAS domain S-box protein n=1 Tax=Marinomonas pontica TaxID=264739 RepID=UPI002244331B|nr:PAS domain S-box protein [Marinomonas pontica]MCW8356982.1 PAS domain S-box protein [Marinomonas pontica]
MIKSVNDKFLKELGCSKEYIVGKTLSELTPSYSRKTEHYNALLGAIKNVKHWVGAVEIEKEDGTEAWLRAIVQPILDGTTGKLKEFALHCNDLTRTITSSREDQNIIAALQRSTAVIEFDMSGHILTANHLFCREWVTNWIKSEVSITKYFVRLKSLHLPNMWDFGHA